MAYVPDYKTGESVGIPKRELDLINSMAMGDETAGPVEDSFEAWELKHKMRMAGIKTEPASWDRRYTRALADPVDMEPVEEMEPRPTPVADIPGKGMKLTVTELESLVADLSHKHAGAEFEIHTGKAGMEDFRKAMEAAIDDLTRKASVDLERRLRSFVDEELYDVPPDERDELIRSMATDHPYMKSIRSEYPYAPHGTYTPPSRAIDARTSSRFRFLTMSEMLGKEVPSTPSFPTLGEAGPGRGLRDRFFPAWAERKVKAVFTSLGLDKREREK